MKKRIGIVVTAFVMVMAMVLTGCGEKFDASAYVKSCIDVITRGEKEEYMKITQRTEEQAQQDYEGNLDIIMEGFSDTGMSEELQEKYRTFFADLLKKTKYEVKEAKESETKGNYTVDVEVEPIMGVFDGLQDELNAATQAYVEELLNSGQTVDEAAANEWVFNTMYDMLVTRMENITYGEKQTVTMNVVLNGKIYEIPEEDYTALDAVLIDYGDMQ